MLAYAMLMIERYLPMMKREEGQGAAEYALILAVVAIVAVLALGSLGGQITTLMAEVATMMTTP
jgi:pilus assembly protein Flp/PilA